ncbi:hypothetical protein CLOSTASPAR_06644 [[Clostridium] asparagiforme DSM 15981]|uniref:Uncharacterized protein n=1 Tax=[Clostridium] asparagiforme DSM 15981 TaxID=518636 RepID=C0DBI9_9FIRM|nr:hypothetical protein CLOSTASPAR_06644 [[Clostridium] asparagiforme DSM 15981]
MELDDFPCRKILWTGLQNMTDISLLPAYTGQYAVRRDFCV